MDKRKILVGVFFLGFILGIIYTNVPATTCFVMSSVFGDYFLNNFQSAIFDWKNFLPMLLRIRVIPLAVIAIITFSRAHKVAATIYCGWIGVLWGCYMSLAVITLGIKGVIFSIVGVIPQIFFYVPAYIIVLLYCYEYPKIRWNVWKSVVVILCMVSGIVLEAQVNPIILKWFIGIM